MSCGGKSYRTGSEAAADPRGSVRVIVDSVCCSREVRSSANVNVDNDGRCGRRYGDESRRVSCGGKSYQTGSEAVAAAEQRGSVRVVVNSVCGGGEFRLIANVEVDDDGRCGR